MGATQGAGPYPHLGLGNGQLPPEAIPGPSCSPPLQPPQGSSPAPAQAPPGGLASFEVDKDAPTMTTVCRRTGGLGPEEGKRDVGQAAGEEMLPWGGVGEDVSISLFLSFAKGMPNTMAG